MSEERRRGFTEEQERNFKELGMRAYLALGLPRDTPLDVATEALDKAMGGNLLAPESGE